MPTLSVRKNNLAAKKSRDARRVRENQLRLRVLCSENQIRWVSEHNWKSELKTRSHRKKREKEKNGRKKEKIVNLTRQNKDRENIEGTGMSYFPISIFYLYLFFSLALGFDLRRSWKCPLVIRSRVGKVINKVKYRSWGGPITVKEMVFNLKGYILGQVLQHKA